jgi:hypothetical protein
VVLVVESFDEYVERIGIVRMGFLDAKFDAATGEALSTSGDGVPAAKMTHRLG